MRSVYKTCNLSQKRICFGEKKNYPIVREICNYFSTNSWFPEGGQKARYAMCKFVRKFWCKLFAHIKPLIMWPICIFLQFAKCKFRSLLEEDYARGGNKPAGKSRTNMAPLASPSKSQSRGWGQPAPGPSSAREGPGGRPGPPGAPRTLHPPMTPHWVFGFPFSQKCNTYETVLGGGIREGGEGIRGKKSSQKIMSSGRWATAWMPIFF